MATDYILEQTHPTNLVREIAFAGDDVCLSGQINYPNPPSPEGGLYPLIFVLPHAGCCSRDDFEAYVRLGLDVGHAVFRWDKRGTGRSGAGGRGSTTQDAINAYETALNQPRVDPHRVVVLAQGEGSLMLGQSFGLFARVHPPAAVLLTANMLDAEQVLAVDAPLQIISSDKDWHDWEVYAKAASEAHDQAYSHGAFYYVAPEASRFLADAYGELHSGAQVVIQNWLTTL